ncbi:Mariner Mos1 transposase [Camponotus japonicus]
MQRNLEQRYAIKFYVKLDKSATDTFRPDIVDRWRLHHDNAPAHTALLVKDFLAKKNVATLPHPPYSPDLSPPDFFLFPKMKRILKGQRFESVPEIQATVTRVLKDIPVEDFKKCFEQWQNRWKRCIDAQGAYFEDY